VEQAEEAFKIASIRYKSGVGINLDVLDAQLNLNNAKTNYISALYDYNVGLATLEKALGFPAVIHKNAETPLATNAETLSSDETK
jgi:outer membrane protein TolC